MNLLFTFLHESSNAGLVNRFNYFEMVKFCEKQSLNTKMSDFK